MTLTPEEIAEKEFAFGLRGYDQEEVRAFLLLVAAEFQAAPNGATGDADGPDPVAELTEAQASGEAAKILQKAHDEADEIRQAAEVDAETTRSRARAILTAAQQEALRLVAEAHARIDRRSIATNGSSATDHGTAPASTVEQLGEEISAMVQARDQVLQQLQEAKTLLDRTVEVAEADPVLQRTAAGTG